MPSKPPRPRTERYEPGIETRPLESSRNVKFDTKRSTPRTPHRLDAIGGTGTRKMTCISGQADTRKHSVPMWDIMGLDGRQLNGPKSSRGTVLRRVNAINGG